MPFLLASPIHQFLGLFGWPYWSLIEFHQASTHFPIGLLLSAVVFDLGAWFTHKNNWREVAFWMQMLGTLALLATLAAGYFGNPYISDSAVSQKAAWHQNFAFATTGLFLFLAAWRVMRHRKVGKLETGLYAAVTLLAVATISFTGWMGAHISQ